MVKELMGGQDEQQRRGFHSTSEPRQHADQDLPPNHWQRFRNSWPATRARDSGSHAESFKKHRKKTPCTKRRTSRMIATWIIPAGKDLAPTGWKIRNSRNHGAGSARCAVPRLSAPGWGSQPGRSLSARLPRRRCPSFFDRSATTPAGARTCPRAFSFFAPVAQVPPCRSSHSRPLHSLRLRRRILGGISATAGAALPACGESDMICAEYGRALEGSSALTLPGPAFSPGGFSGLSGPAGNRHRAFAKNEIRCPGPLRAWLRHGRRPY